jgi:hypothetical protein
MKKVILSFLAIAFSSIAYSQSILSDKATYKVKRLQTNKGYEATVPLNWGDKKTLENVSVVYAVDSLEKLTADTLYDIKTLWQLNSQSKYKCKNPYSWRPSSITIMHNTETNKVSVIVRGSAENAYGSRGEVTFYYNRKDTEFISF